MGMDINIQGNVTYSMLSKNTPTIEGMKIRAASVDLLWWRKAWTMHHLILFVTGFHGEFRSGETLEISKGSMMEVYDIAKDLAHSRGDDEPPHVYDMEEIILPFLEKHKADLVSFTYKCDW